MANRVFRCWGVRSTVLGFFVAVVLVVAGCGSIPDDGDPVPVEDKNSEPTVRVNP
ncbi:MAG: hypothetical protein ACRDTD_33035 [Pseudonocardiaceae bacterium]